MIFSVIKNCRKFVNRILFIRKHVRESVRSVCSGSAASQTALPLGGPTERSVFISQSQDIHYNLALEDWFYRHEDFSKHRILLLWQNSETVVIGRHQNIWTEVDVEEAERRHVRVARRNSGGGAVYHDLGNLNCSFFTTRADYNRRFNLEIVRNALRKLGFGVDINCKDDLMLNGSKISGTASKLGKNSYHHCTLLVGSDLQTLSTLLNPNIDGFVSRATKSKKSPVTNLKAINHDTTVSHVLTAIGHEFLQTDSRGVDGGLVEAQKQRGFQLLNPTDEWFPGLEEIRTHFASWDWTFAKTPDFTLTRHLEFGSGKGTCDIALLVVKGIIRSPVAATFSDDALPGIRADLTSFLDTVTEKPFNPLFLQTLERWGSCKVVAAASCQ